MRYGITLLIGLVVTVAAAAAIASTTAKDPVKLTLQQADLPAGARLSIDPASGLRAIGKGLRGANFTAEFGAGGTITTPLGDEDKEWYLEGDVIVARSPGAARAVFRLGRAARIGFFSDFPTPSHRITLPKFGDQQFAFASKPLPGRAAHAAVFVRKGSVVWELSVNPLPYQWRPSNAALLTQLKAYAAKQKARVGSG